MVVKLLHSARINHEAGEVVTVSPAQGDFLLAIGSAVRVEPTICKVERVTVDAETAEVTPKRTVRKAAKK